MSETIVPAVYHDLPVVTNRKQISEYTTRLGDMEFPAFVVKSRSSYIHEYGARDRHFDVVGDVLQAMKRSTGLAYDERSLEDFTGLGQKSIGDLHEDFTVSVDSSPFELPFCPYVHTTVSGGGDVYMAFAGNRLDLNFQRSGTNFYTEHPDVDPHGLLLQGNVDTDIMNPNIYRHPLRRGDSVVFTGVGPGAPWHRFDTQQDLGKRIVTATEIMHPDV